MRLSQKTSLCLVLFFVVVGMFYPGRPAQAQIPFLDPSNVIVALTQMLIIVSALSLSVARAYFQWIMNGGFFNLFYTTGPGQPGFCFLFNHYWLSHGFKVSRLRSQKNFAGPRGHDPFDQLHARHHGTDG